VGFFVSKVFASSTEFVSRKHTQCGGDRRGMAPAVRACVWEGIDLTLAWGRGLLSGSKVYINMIRATPKL
jgi:hypothetical protein